MKWNGRTYRPANAQYITKKKPFDFQEALKPYGEKELPVWNAIVAVNNIPTPTTTPVLWFAANGSGQVEGYSITSSATTWSGATVTGATNSAFLGVATNGSNWGAIGWRTNSLFRDVFNSNNGSEWSLGQDIRNLFQTTTYTISTNGSIWLIGGESSYPAQATGATTVAYSYDGITYSAATISVQSGSAKPRFIESFAYNGSMWLGGGFSTGTSINSTYLINSTDGVNWSGQTNPIFSGQVQSIAYGNGKWVASQFVSNNNGKLLASTDGFNWTASTNATNSTLFSTTLTPNNVIFFDNKFVATTASSSGATTHIIIYSTDGLTWSACTDTKTLINRGINKIASNGSVLIATSTTGSSGNAVTTYISNNGINWSANTSNINTIFTGIGSIQAFASNVQIQPNPIT